MPEFGPRPQGEQFNEPENNQELGQEQDKAIDYLESLKSKSFNELLDELYELDSKSSLKEEGFSDLEQGFFVRILSSVEDMGEVSQDFLGLTFDRFQELHNYIKEEESKVEESVKSKYPKESPEVIEGISSQQKRKRHNEINQQLKSEAGQLILLANRLKSGLDTGSDPLGEEAARWNQLSTSEQDAYIYFLATQEVKDLEY